MKKVVVTGVSGFVGRHLLEELLKEKIEVYAVSRRENTIFEGHEKLHWIVGDLFSDTEQITESLKKAGAQDSDCFYHLAWNGVAASEKNNYEVQITNITIAMNTLRICKEIGCKKFLNLGTVAEYVSLDGVISDQCVPTPADIYGAVKVSVKNLLTVQAKRDGIGLINTILCSTFGEHRCDDNVISYTIKTLLRGEVPTFGALNQMWDFMYVEDAAHALYLLGEKGLPDKTYGIGSCVYKRLYEYIYEIRDMINPELQLQIGALSKYEKVLNSCVDSYQLQKDTGFCTKYTFREGIERTIEYFRREQTCE